MADTRRELLIQYAKDQVDAAGKPAGLIVHRSRLLPIDDEDLEGGGAVVIYPMQDTRGTRTQGANGSAADLTLRLRFEVRVRGKEPDVLVDPIYSWIVQQMLADTTCGGLARTVDEIGTTWDRELMVTSYGAAAVDIEIEYRRNLKNPETAA